VAEAEECCAQLRRDLGELQAVSEAQEAELAARERQVGEMQVGGDVDCAALQNRALDAHL
jgi:hypothetical protein